MSTPPPHKRQKSTSNAEPQSSTAEVVSDVPLATPTATPIAPPTLVSAATPVAPRPELSLAPPPPSPTNPRKRARSKSPKLDTLPPGTTLPPPVTPDSRTDVSISRLLNDDSGKKRGRTNTPWTAGEEQRLKQMRDASKSWSEIAKAFPSRTEGSVKKHWYKDMHYAEFAEDESVALREAIREYEANKWRAIGAKLGKPAKACEQYAKEHFKNL